MGIEPTSEAWEAKLNPRFPCPNSPSMPDLARKIRDFRNTEGLAMVQIRYLGRFETKNEAFA